MMIGAVRVAAISVFSICVLCAFACADTIITNDARELKGVVVEEFKDRYVISTPQGEKSVMKENVKDLVFDEEEGNLIMLAEKARNRQDYARAISYYEEALKINPSSVRARDGLTLSKVQSFKREEQKKQSALSIQEEIDRQGGPLIVPKADQAMLKESRREQDTVLGLVLGIKHGYPVVESVKKDSPAYDAGIRRGDRVASVWDMLTRYLTIAEVRDLLSSRGSAEIKCTIERTVTIPVSSARGGMSCPGLIGASLDMKYEGLTVTDVKKGCSADGAGLERGDLVVAIDGMSTRYMPLGNALSMIRAAKNDSLDLTLRKDVIIWQEQ